MTTKNSYNSLHQKIKSEWRGRWLQFRCFSLFFFLFRFAFDDGAGAVFSWRTHCSVSLILVSVCVVMSIESQEHMFGCSLGSWRFAQADAGFLGAAAVNNTNSETLVWVMRACASHPKVVVVATCFLLTKRIWKVPYRGKGVCSVLFFFFLHLHKVGGKRCYLCPQSAQQPFLVFGIVAWASAFLITFFYVLIEDVLIYIIHLLSIVYTIQIAFFFLAALETARTDSWVDVCSFQVTTCGGASERMRAVFFFSFFFLICTMMSSRCSLERTSYGWQVEVLFMRLSLLSLLFFRIWVESKWDCLFFTCYVRGSYTP